MKPRDTSRSEQGRNIGDEEILDLCFGSNMLDTGDERKKEI